MVEGDVKLKFLAPEGVVNVLLPEDGVVEEAGVGEVKFLLPEEGVGVKVLLPEAGVETVLLPGVAGVEGVEEEANVLLPGVTGAVGAGLVGFSGLPLSLLGLMGCSAAGTGVCRFAL